MKKVKTKAITLFIIVFSVFFLMFASLAVETYAATHNYNGTNYDLFGSSNSYINNDISNSWSWGTSGGVRVYVAEHGSYDTTLTGYDANFIVYKNGNLVGIFSQCSTLPDAPKTRWSDSGNYPAILVENEYTFLSTPFTDWYRYDVMALGTTNRDAAVPCYQWNGSSFTTTTATYIQIHNGGTKNSSSPMSAGCLTINPTSSYDSFRAKVGELRSSNPGRIKIVRGSSSVDPWHGYYIYPADQSAHTITYSARPNTKTYPSQPWITNPVIIGNSVTYTILANTNEDARDGSIRLEDGGIVTEIHHILQCSAKKTYSAVMQQTGGSATITLPNGYQYSEYGEFSFRNAESWVNIASTRSRGSLATVTVSAPSTSTARTSTVQVWMKGKDNPSVECHIADIVVTQAGSTPLLSNPNYERISDSAATIGFTANVTGTAFYSVASSGAQAPDITTIANGGTSLGSVSGTVSGKTITLTAGAKDVYIVLRDSVGTISTPLKISIPAMPLPPVPAGAEIHIETATAAQGDIVRVPVMITKNPGIGDAFIKFDFPNDLTLTAFDGAGGMNVDTAESAVARKEVWLHDTDETIGYTGSLLVTLVFTVSETATEGLKEINILASESSYATPMAQSIPVSYSTGGGITVTPPIPDPVNTFAFEVVNTTGVVGSTITVPVRLVNNPGFAAVTLNVSYDTSVLQLLDVKAPQPDMALSSQFVLTDTGNQRISMFNPSFIDYANDDVILNLTFKIKAIANGENAPIDLSFTTTPPGEPSRSDEHVYQDAITCSGYVTILNFIYGDVTGDGIVNNADLLRMMRYFALDGISLDLNAADVTADGIVNNADLLRMMRYFAQDGIVLGPIDA